MIPDHVVTLAIVLVVLWVLYRWGDFIFTLWAIFYFWRGEWDLAVLSWIYACFLTLVRAWGSWLDWNLFGRRAWLRERLRWFPRASYFD